MGHDCIFHDESPCDDQDPQTTVLLYCSFQRIWKLLNGAMTLVLETVVCYKLIPKTYAVESWSC